ncbi:C2 domain-containing protein, partial [Tribonema minus]
MIEPLYHRSPAEQLQFEVIPDGDALQCWKCQQDKQNTPALYTCTNCGRNGVPRPYCKSCFDSYHLYKRGRAGHKPRPIVSEDAVVVQTLQEGDDVTFPAMHQWVTVHYTLRSNESPAVVERKDDFSFQSGCSGPCLHLQLLGCRGLPAADLLGASDPFCVIYWDGIRVGATTVRYFTTNPRWNNQTFVLPLEPAFIGALLGGEAEATFRDSAALPRLHVDVFDWDRFGGNDFLGQMQLSTADLLSL